MSRMLQVSSKERKSQGDTWEYSLHIRKQAEVVTIATHIGLARVVETIDMQEQFSRDTLIHHYFFSI